MKSLLLLFTMTQGDISSLGEEASATGEQTIFKAVMEKKVQQRSALAGGVLRHCLLSYVRGVVT